MQRRHLLQSIAALGLAAPMVGLERLRHEVLATATATGQPVDSAEWEAIAWDYARTYATTAPATLLTELTTDLLVAHGQLQRLTNQSDRRTLQRVLALLGVFLAQTVGNLGSVTAGRRWWRFARRLADASADSEARTWVRGREIIRSLYEHQPLEAVIALADEAAGISARPGMGTGSVLMGRAQALAMMGRADDARTATQTVYTMLDSLPAAVTDDTTSMFGWPEYRLRHGESFVYTYIDEPVLAEQAQDRAIALYPHAMFRERAQVQLHRALRLVRTGDTAGGVDYAVQTLHGLPGDQQIAAVIEIGRSVASVVPAGEHGRDGFVELRHLVSGPAAVERSTR